MNALDAITGTLIIYLCSARRAYRVTFSTEAQCLAFLERKLAAGDYNWDEIPGHHGEGLGSIPGSWTTVLDFLYPMCEHGMSQDSCYGPDHFMSAAQEEAMDWQYDDYKREAFAGMDQD